MKKAFLSLVVGSAAAAAWGGAAHAQTHKVTSPDTVVRAVGVYEWTGDLAKPSGSRFVPVTVFIDGELQDGGIYLPRPVPFALLSGNVYELEDAGLARGTVELESALQTTTPDGAPARAFDEGWTAYGSYKPPAQPKKSAALRPSKTLPVITTSGGDSRPHLTDKSAAGKSGDQQKSTDQQKSPDQQKSAGASTSDDTDRPTMHRRSDDTASASDSSADPSQTSSDDDKAERPTLRRRSPEDAKDAKDEKQKKRNDVATVTSAGSLNDDPDRPTLKHTPRAQDSAGDMPKLLGVPPDMKQMVAVSDAKTRDPHPFARPWEDTAERAAVLAKMQAFARAKLADYGIVPGATPPTAIAGTKAAAASTKTAASASTTTSNIEGAGPPKLKRGAPTDDTTADITPPPPTAPAKSPTAHTTATIAAAQTSAARHNAAKGPAPVVLADEELKGYLLSYGGAPTYVYMAHTVETGSVMRYVTLVAQADAVGELKLALASVTDAAHLDRVPWMRLVDAVDVEASNRASLLFELRGQSSRQFAVYRVIAAKPEQIFVTGS